MDDLGVPLGNRKHVAGCEYEVSDVSDMASHSKDVDPDWVWYFHSHGHLSVISTNKTSFIECIIP